MTKHQKPTAVNPQGGIINKEAPIHVSNVAFYDSKSKSAGAGYPDERTGSHP